MKALLLTFNLLCGGDSLTTHAIIMRGGHEAWMPVQHPDAIIALNTAQCYAVSQTSRLPRKLGLPILIGATIARGWAVQHNTRLLVAR